MKNQITKHGLTQDSFERHYNSLKQQLDLSTAQLDELLTYGDDSYLISFLQKNNISNQDISIGLKLKSIFVSSVEESAEHTSRKFSTTSIESGSEFFKPLGDFQDNNDGLLSSSSSLCDTNCKGIVVGQFLSEQSSLLAYHKPELGAITYRISYVDQSSLNTNVVNTLNVGNLFASSDLKIEKINANNDAFDDIIISERKNTHGDYPVIFINSGDGSFDPQYRRLDNCGGISNIGSEVITGAFMGPNTASIWCRKDKGQNEIFEIQNSNLIYRLAKTNWCTTGSAYVIDFNGDKYSDILCITDYEQFLLLSAQGKFFKPASVHANGKINFLNIRDSHKHKILIGDFDNNGREDVLQLSPEGYNWLYLSEGKKFFNYDSTRNNNYIAIGGGGIFCRPDDHYVTGDFNQDYKYDLACITSNKQYFMLSQLKPNNVIINSIASLTYRDYYLSPPANLEDYKTTISSSKNFFNAQDSGPVTFNTPLSLDIQFTNWLESFYKDIRSTESVFDGKVTYSRESSNGETLIKNASTLSGYKAQEQDKNNLSHDWHTLQRQISGNIITPYGGISLSEDVQVTLLPNKCLKAEMKAYLYKNVPVNYTAQGYFTAKNQQGYPILGENLLDLANTVFKHPVMLHRNNEIVFNTSGTLMHTVLQHVETAIIECSEPSQHQNTSIIPQVNSLLVYKDYELYPPSIMLPYSDTYKSSHRYINNKTYSQSEFEAPLSLSFKLTNSMPSFVDDIKSSQYILNGKVVYVKQYSNGESLQHNTNVITDYKLSTNTRNENLEYDFHTPQQKISTNILSDWDEVALRNNVKFTIVPGQCEQVEMVAHVYKDIVVPYTAKGYFSAKNEQGHPVLGDKLKQLAEATFKHDVTLHSESEAVFNVAGELYHTMLDNVEVLIHDC